MIPQMKRMVLDFIVGRMDTRVGATHALAIASTRSGLDDHEDGASSAVPGHASSRSSSGAMTIEEDPCSEEDKQEDFPGGDGPEDDESSEEPQQQQQREEHHFWTSIFVKLKIIIAAYQIASSIPWSLPGVDLPEITTTAMAALNIVQLNLVQFGSVDCTIELHYFGELCVVTTLPFVLAILAVAIYLIVIGLCQKRCFSDDEESDDESTSSRETIEQKWYRSRHKSRIIYGLLLLSYVALPGCASYTFRYFSCLRYQRGDERNDLRVLAIDPTIRCGSNRYRHWFPHVLLLIFVWPVGQPLLYACVLWRYRKHLNPPILLDDDTPDVSTSSSSEKDTSSSSNNAPALSPRRDPAKSSSSCCKLFRRAQQKQRSVERELLKIDQRQGDEALFAIEFLYEEYEPRCYMFPVFEALRRIFLTGIVSMFYPGSSSQITVGLLGAMLSYKIFSHFQPYIEDDDDIVSEVAQSQLVIIFFSALVIYVADSNDEREGVFSSNIFGILLIISSSQPSSLVFTLFSLTSSVTTSSRTT